jgi:hypothetical protein
MVAMLPSTSRLGFIFFEKKKEIKSNNIAPAYKKVRNQKQD